MTSTLSNINDSISSCAETLHTTNVSKPFSPYVSSRRSSACCISGRIVDAKITNELILLDMSHQEPMHPIHSHLMSNADHIKSLWVHCSGESEKTYDRTDKLRLPYFIIDLLISLIQSQHPNVIVVKRSKIYLAIMFSNTS